MTPLRRNAIRLAGRFQQLLNGSGQAAQLPIVIVNEYPKSGGTWFARVLAATVALPFVEDSALPLHLPSVARTPWTPRKPAGPAVYMMRDGRDVMVSLFHHRVRRVSEEPEAYAGKRWAHVRGLDADQVRAQLQSFMSETLENGPQNGVAPWPDHVRAGVQLHEQASRAAVVRYESMLTEPVATVQGAVKACFGTDASDTLVQAALDLVDRQQRESTNLTGAVESSVRRSASSGGWRSSFTRETGRLFALATNDTLIAQGFEDDPNWWKDLPES